MEEPSTQDLDRGFLTAACMVAAALALVVRLHGIGDRSLWLDEILGVTGVGPEHGPLYYGVLRFSEAIAPSDFGFRLPFVLAGALSAAVITLVAAELAGPAVGAASGVLLAMSPLHIYLSRQARPYSLLVLIFLLGALALLRRDRTDAARGWHLLLAASALGLVLVSVLGLSYVVPLATGAAVVPSRRGWRRRIGWATGMSVSSGALAIFLYHPLLKGEAPAAVPLASGARQLLSLLQALLAGYRDGDPLTLSLLPWLCLVVAGIAVLAFRRPPVAAALALTATAGFLVPYIAIGSRGHGVAVRYLLAALPSLLILAAAGPALLWTRWTARRRTGAVAGAVIASIAALGWIPEIGRARQDRADWRRVAALVASLSHDGDLVVTSNDWPMVCLRYYLPKVGAGPKVVSAEESVPKAKGLVGKRNVALLVTGGFHVTTEIRTWMDGFPALLRDPTEGIAVHAYPDRVTHRVARANAQQLAEDAVAFWRQGGRLDFGPSSEPFLGSGWSSPETYGRGHPFRWAVGRSCTIYVPTARPLPSRIGVSLRTHPALAGRQSVTISVNGAAAETFPISGWTDRQVDVRSLPWRAGANVVRFAFSDARRPEASEPRVLAAAFRYFWIERGDAAGARPESQ